MGLEDAFSRLRIGTSVLQFNLAPVSRGSDRVSLLAPFSGESFQPDSAVRLDAHHGRIFAIYAKTTVMTSTVVHSRKPDWEKF
jgi:hypothetical protein